MAVLVTPAIAQEIAEIIRQHYGALAGILYGKDAVSEADWEAAKRLGLVDESMAQPVVAEALHAYGAMLAHLDQADHQSRYGTTLADFMAEIAREPVPQTEIEHLSAKAVRQRGAQAVTALGRRAVERAGQVIIEHDAELGEKIRGTMRDVIAARFGDDEAARRVREAGAEQGLDEEFFARQFRTTIDRQVSDIGHLTGEWTRDLERVVQTESHNAVQQAMKESFIEQERTAAQAEGRAAREVLVYKLPRPDACRYCIALHLDGGVPRIFKLSELDADNVGRTKAQWQAVVGAVHPYCSCSLHRVPSILRMPEGWRSGQAAPSVIGLGGQLVMGAG